MDNIEKNLYAFYRYFGVSYKVQLIIGKDYSAGAAENANWPQIIFNINQSIPPEEFIGRIVSEITIKNLPQFFVVPESYISSKHSGILKKYSVVPVKILSGMNMKVKLHNDFSLPDGSAFQELTSDDQLNQYSELINSELLSKELPLNLATFKSLKNSEIKKFGLVKNEMLISAISLCLFEETGGLYFLATKKEFQKQGYACTLMKSTINFAHTIHLKELILHANQSSVGLHKKIGFIHQNRFIIYKKL